MALLELADVGASFGMRVVLAGVSLRLENHSALFVMGPGGAGKSTLLRLLSCANNAQPTFSAWGDVFYRSKLLSPDNRPSLLQQSARLLLATVQENVALGFPTQMTKLEQRVATLGLFKRYGVSDLADLDAPVVQLSRWAQRCVGLLRLVASKNPLLMLDEPTADLEDGERNRMLELLERVLRDRALIVVTHNRQDALHIGGQVLLLTDGRAEESAPTHAFFTAPTTTPGQSFVQQGNCRASVDLPSAPPVVPRAFGPTGFLWLDDGRIAGSGRPGLLAPLEHDLRNLRNLGIHTVISLEAEHPPPVETLTKYGLESRFEPIVDMGAPTIEQCRRVLGYIDDCNDRGRAVLVHCRGGLGRTGTILAAHLVARGMSALSAIEKVREIEPRLVQSDAQRSFLSQFSQEPGVMRAPGNPA